MREWDYVQEPPALVSDVEHPPPHPLHFQDCLPSSDNDTHYTTFQVLRSRKENVKLEKQ